MCLNKIRLYHMIYFSPFHQIHIFLKRNMEFIKRTMCVWSKLKPTKQKIRPFLYSFLFLLILVKYNSGKWPLYFVNTKWIK